MGTHAQFKLLFSFKCIAALMCAGFGILAFPMAIYAAEMPHFFVPHHGGQHGDFLPDYAAVATKVITQSGPWSSVVGTLASSDVVLIEEGVEVVYDVESDAPFDAIAIKGTLRFADDRNTKLTVSTVEVYATGMFTIGTETQPLPRQFTAQVVFVGTIDLDKDPGQFSVGLITGGGTVVIHGESTNVPFTKLAAEANIGDASITLVEPVDWFPGDTIYLSEGLTYNDGTKNFPAYEVLTMDSVNGQTVTLSQPLSKFHETYVANFSRNIIFKTDRAALGNQGHILFGGDTDVFVHGATMLDLGRTTVEVLDDTLRNHMGEVVHIGINQRARYPLHGHHLSTAFSWKNNVIRNDPVVQNVKWGIVNHDSFGVIEDNIVMGLAGGGIVGEQAEEMGTVHHNLVIGLGGGSRKPDYKRFKLKDFLGNPLFDRGHGGNCYWFAGVLLEVTENVAVGNCGREAYQYNPELLTEITLPDIPGIPIDLRGSPTLDMTATPIRLFENNIVDGFNQGVVPWGFASQQNMIKGLRMILRSQGSAIGLAHSSGVTEIEWNDIELCMNVQCAFSKWFLRSTGLSAGSFGSEKVTLSDSKIIGFTTGVSTVKGAHYMVIRDTLLENVTNVSVLFPPKYWAKRKPGGRDVLLENVVFGSTLPPDIPPGEEPTNILMQFGDKKGRLPLMKDEKDVFTLLNKTMLQMRVEVQNYNQTGENFLVYFAEQAPDAEMDPLFINPTTGQPWTNQEAWDDLGIAINGSVAPIGTRQRIDGLVGPVIPRGPDVVQTSRALGTEVSYPLRYTVDGVVFTEDIQIVPGLNYVTRPLPSGGKYTFLVFGDFPSANEPFFAITSPQNGGIVAGSSVDVRYTKGGNLTGISHAHFTLDGTLIMDINFDGRLTFTGVPTGNHTLVGFLVDANHQEIPGTREEVSFVTTNVLPEPLCIQTTFAHRTRKGKTHELSTAFLRISDQISGEIIKDVTLSVDTDGKLILADTTNIEDDTISPYIIAFSPKGHISQMLTDQTNLLSNSCIPFPPFQSGDWDGDSQITLPELITAVRHFVQNDSALLADIYRHGMTLGDLVELVRVFVTQ